MAEYNEQEASLNAKFSEIAYDDTPPEYVDDWKLITSSDKPLSFYQ